MAAVLPRAARLSRCVAVALHEQQCARPRIGHTQTRAYAQATVGAGKMKKKKGKNPDKIPVKLKDNPGMFRAMPPNALTHEVFQSDNRKTLNLPHFAPENVHKNYVGSALGFTSDKHAPHNVYGLPKKLLLEYRLLSKPCSVLREVTVETAALLDAARSHPSTETRAVLTGRAGCGKSVVLLQLVEYCKAKDWVVIYIPRAVDLVNSTTTHVYDIRTRTYVQPDFSYQLLMRMTNVNSKAFGVLLTKSELDFGRNDVPKLPAGSALDTLVAVGMRDRTLAPLVLDFVIRELEQQTEHPVLLAIDEFQSLYCKTAYRDPHFAGISSYHLSIPRMLLEYACGKRTFKHGAVLGALNSTETILSTPIELRDTLDLPSTHPDSPYYKRSTTLLDYAKGLKKVPVPDQLSMDEAAGIYDVWKNDGALITSTHDETFMAKYSESSGNARDFVWNGLLASIDS